MPPTNKHKKILQSCLFVFLIIALLGPWVLENISVPSEYPCSNSIRLRENICGIPISGLRILFLAIGGMIGSIIRLMTSEVATAYGAHEVLFALVPFLFILPVFSMIPLLGEEDKPRWKHFYIESLCLTVIMGLPYIIFYIISNITFLSAVWALWGIWLYMGVTISLLILEADGIVRK